MEGIEPSTSFLGHHPTKDMFIRLKPKLVA